MAIRVKVRRRRGVYYWTMSSSRPYTWNGPWRTADEAHDKATESLRRAQQAIWRRSTDTVDGRTVDRRPDLRQMAWLWWPEMR